MSRRPGFLRYGVVWNRLAYELFWICSGKDESIYLASYREGSRIGVVTVSAGGTRRTVGGLDITTIPTVKFSPHKMSFHPSGYIHSTDESGQRLVQFDGVRGLQFGRITDCATLFSIYPTSPEDYRKRTGLGKSVQLVDIRHLGFVPLQITCYLAKSGYDFSKETHDLNALQKSLSKSSKSIAETLLRFNR